jgi:hypothetical protein
MADDERRDSSRESRGTLAWALRAALLVVGLLSLGVLTARVARVYPVSSDDATGVLEAASVLRGNPLLSGWTVSNVSFVMTDLPFYVVGVAIRGLKPSLLRDVPSAVYAVAVGIAAILAASGVRRGGLAAATVLVLLALPAGGLAEFVTKGYTRVGTSISLFVALLALGMPPGQKVTRARLWLYTVAVALALLSDTFMLVIAVVPVLLVCLLGAIRGEGYENIGVWRIALATILTVPLALGATWLIRIAGGLEVEPLPLTDYLPGHDPWRPMAANLRALAEYLPSLYRCDPPHRGGPPEWAVWLGCLLGPVLLVAAIGWARPAWRGRRREDFVGDVLWISMGLVLAAFLVSANEKDRGTLRYMVPFVLCGAVLTGRVIGERGRLGGVLAGALGVLAASYAVTVAWELRKPPADDPAMMLAGWLERHGLRHGYGPYWDASIVTVCGGGRVAVRPVRGRELKRGLLVVEPFRWMSDEEWYIAAPANFVVYRPDPGPKYHFRINDQNCEGWFGRPSARYTVGPYVVLVWEHDLRSRLTKGLRWTP